MRIGVDLGGTKIEAIALADDGHIRVRQRVSTPRDYRETVRAIARLVLDVEEAAGAVGTVGVGIPGTIVPATGLVKNANSTGLIGQPLERDLERALDRPVRIMNDANCFALSEATDGAAAGADVVFGVILGTGVGGGIVVRGECLIGANLIAGEWGHNALPWVRIDELPGPRCYCGKQGCIESWLSGPGLARDHERVTGERRDAASIAALARDGDQGARASLDRYVERLGRALSSVINIIDPDVVVLGGGMSNVDGLAESVQARLHEHVFSDVVLTRVARNVHGDSSGVRGAAWLWPRGVFPSRPGSH
jgi:fructokinase